MVTPLWPQPTEEVLHQVLSEPAQVLSVRPEVLSVCCQVAGRTSGFRARTIVTVLAAAHACGRQAAG